ncbi:MAG: NADH-quinone oxidoreductase subunit C [Actinomycetota bacterium]
MVSQPEVRYGQVWATVTAERLVDAVRVLKNDPDLDCNFFTFLSAVDWQEKGLEIVVMLYSTNRLVTVGLKVPLGPGVDRVQSITGVYRGANWHERECAEMFGITFEGHPKLTNLYLSDDFVGHPLLKSFPLASRTYKPWPGAKDPSEAAGGGR